MTVPPLCLLELHFRAVRPINKLPHFHGPQWYALIKHLIKPYLKDDRDPATFTFALHPIETGVFSYAEGEAIHLGLSLSIDELPLIAPMLSQFNTLTAPDGHFLPSRTIVLEGIMCRITGERIGPASLFKPNSVGRLSSEHIEEEIDLLTELEEFSLIFYSPLRLTRPITKKEKGHRYCDEGFFFSSYAPSIPIEHLLTGIKRRIEFISPGGMKDEIITPNPLPPVFIADGGLIWHDVSYGNRLIKTMGGVVGGLLIRGRPSRWIAELLVLGQYTGLGKNRAFGFGGYIIPELEGARRIKSFSRGKSLFKRAVEPELLKNALMRLPISSPGLDGITVEDIKRVKDNFIKNLHQSLLSGTYEQGGLKKYRMPKEDGKFRDIYIQNVSDRIVHKAYADFLAPIVDRLLLTSAYAYRRGLSRKSAAESLKEAMAEGYSCGVKADIATFFDSVNLKKLSYFLEGLFAFDELPSKISTLLEHFSSLGVRGLPQGSPLSPVLSNLYLTGFDKNMENQGFRLARYADDFVILTKDGLPKEELLKRIQKSLSRLDLSLKEEKIEEVRKDTPLKFLGYLVSEAGISEAEKEKGDEEEWPPIFKDEWITGEPVYLTCLSRGAYSNGPDLVVKSENDEVENIPWSSIGRIVVVGRSSVSGGVVYRAVREGIPVVFIDILGRARGSFYPEYYEMPDISNLQDKFANDIDYTLAFAREIISAKIHNSIVLLRRNGIESKDLKELEDKALEASSIEALRGYEGAAAKVFFSEFAHLVEPFEFKGRIYHPPDGPVNVMLSLGYTILYNRIAAVLKAKGFKARLGFFHKGRGAHNALASDLLEELRHIAERVTLSLIHRSEIHMEDFQITKRKEIEISRITGEGFRKFIRRFEKVMASKASYTGRRMSYNLYLDEMVDNLKRSLKLKIPYTAMRID